MRHEDKQTMEEQEAMVYLLLGLWFFVTGRLKAEQKKKQSNKKREWTDVKGYGRRGKIPGRSTNNFWKPYSVMKPRRRRSAIELLSEDA